MPAAGLRRPAYLQFAVYYRETEGRDAQHLARAKLAGFELVDELAESPARPQARVFSPRYEDYAPPSRDYLDEFGYGFEAAGATERLRETNRVVVVEIVAPVAGASSAQQRALELVTALAAELDGFAWDEVTRELFTREAWGERVQSFDAENPSVGGHIAAHFYRADGGPRLITLGMAKFGLPDVVVENLPASSATSMRTLVYVVCQTMLERGRIERIGKLELDVHALRHAEFRDTIREMLIEGATGKATLDLAAGRWQEGDPHNRLVEIVFPGKRGDLHVRQEALLSELFGVRDEVTHVEHDQELLALSRRAQQELLALKPRFEKKAPETELLLVKAPFERSQGGNEWMWVEVTSWKGTTISGILQNQPHDVPNLRSGSLVSFDESKAFDYIHRRDDGTEVGNETGKLMMQREQQATER